jgi:predicted deacetylase
MSTGPEATYLLRFDDICPTMKWRNWEPIESVLAENDIKPILAVVPDNRDSDLQVESPNPDFWNRVRRWQAAGWALGLHGFQHKYVTSDPGLYSNRRASEFAGLTSHAQREKLKNGLAILRDEGVNSNLWIAPGHSFDRTTVSTLAELGITSISDGFSVAPYTDDEGIFWIPQQQLSEENILSSRGAKRIAPKSRGVWTVCLHPNAWSEADISRFKHDAHSFRHRITTADEVERRYRGRKVDWLDRINAVRCDARRRLGLLIEKHAPPVGVRTDDPKEQFGQQPCNSTEKRKHL